jgi:excisionase family DNA binding protein
MKLEDGSVVTGEYDMVPIIDKFVEEHPDFSYKGAKGMLALTGYEGTLGYRTNDPSSPTYDQDKKTVKEVAKVLQTNTNYVYELMNSGSLPYLVLGSKKVRGSDLEKFINTYPNEKTA